MINENALAKTVNKFPEKWRILKYPFCDINEWYYLSVASNGNNNSANHDVEYESTERYNKGSWLTFFIYFLETFYFHGIFNIWLTV